MGDPRGGVRTPPTGRLRALCRGALPAVLHGVVCAGYLAYYVESLGGIADPVQPHLVLFSLTVYAVYASAPPCARIAHARAPHCAWWR